MPRKDLRIIFMGTPDFAVPSLKILLEKKYAVVAVITSPDKPAGRGLKMTSSPVKQIAVENNIPVLQPLNLKSPEFLEELRSYKANLQIVVAFRMLPEMVWAMPSLGTFNLHASLLPDYRGAAPINWAIINGEKQTGCTTFFLKQEIDTGDIILQEKEIIHPEDTFESLYKKLMTKGAELVLKTVQKIEEESVQPIPQNHSGVIKLAPKLSKDLGKIDWSKASEEIENFVRGLSPYPAAWTLINGKLCKIFRVKADTSDTNESKATGSLFSDNKTFLKMSTGNGFVLIQEIQMEGKKRMTAEEFLRGNKI